MRRGPAVLSALALVAPLLVVMSPAQAAPAPPARVPVSTQSLNGDRLAVYSGVIDPAQLDALTDLGLDRRELDLSATADGTGLRVETILSGRQVEDLAAQGLRLEPGRAPGAAPGDGRADALAEPGESVFQRYAGEGGIREEMEQQVAAYPRLTELVTIGTTVAGQDIVGVKVGLNAARTPDGAKPTTVYLGAQHAREWITPEMVTRLLDHVLTGYGQDPELTRLLNRSELWFIPVANPDGYDFTFTEGQRLWRKNLRDNNGDGQITPGDGVDLNRNFPTKWGYDNEGSSPNPASEVYRGPAPASEPETQALDELFARITPEFLVNYHSAAELLLYGVGWQVSTPTPDDVLYEALVGDDADPAVPGYDPDISAELYTTNGDTDTHLQEAYGSLGFTPEMSTCEAASDSVEGDAWEAADCGSGFEFPDDEALVQAEFEKNIAFALSVAASADDPANPESVVGRTAEDFRLDSFEVSYGDPQTVAVIAKRSLREVVMRYRVNGTGPTHRADVAEWEGGERYGDENDDYFAELRGRVEGTAPGDTVEVWFEGRRGGRVSSERFSYTVAQDTGNDVLVIANEDYTGVNPDYPDDVTAPRHLQAHLDALAANGVTADTWDVDAQGVPHDLGVLGHYDAVLWYLGDNRLTQDPEDELTETFFQDPAEDLAVADEAQYLTLAVRDFLNEGGKLVHTGETAGYFGALGSALGGIWYGLDGAPEQDCVVTEDPFSDCLLLADDFTQYYLGAYARTPLQTASGVAGVVGSPFAGLSAAFADPADLTNPVEEAGAFTVTSDVLPVEDFPQFASEAGASYTGAAGPFIPVEGAFAAAARHQDDSFVRLTRTFDLTGVGTAESPTFQAQLSWDTEAGYDHVIVEARTAGGDDWTTLPEVGGATTSEVPTECEAGFLLALHPWLGRYLSAGDLCLPQGTTGTWSSLTGSSDGWQEVGYDLSAYAGGEVELSISYVTDPGTGGAGLIVDDTRLVTANGVVRDAEGFEDGFGAWAVQGAPEGSPAAGGVFELSQGLGGITSAVLTEDTVLLGFGLEQLAGAQDRAAVAGAALGHLGLRP